MFDAQISPASVFKRLVDALKDLVSDTNWECNEEGLTMQAMDNSHVALVTIKLDRAGFTRYRCDRPIPLGVNVDSLKKVLRAARDTDSLNLKATEDADLLNLVFEANDRVSEYDMKLLDIDRESLDIPDTEYDAHVTMASADFSRICRDLSVLGDNVKLDVSKERITFSLEGDVANGSVSLKQSADSRMKYARWAKKNEMKSSMNLKDRKYGNYKVKKEEDDDDEDDDEEAESESESESEGRMHIHTKRKSSAEDESNGVHIDMDNSVALSFSLKLLSIFAKAANLVDTVVLSLGQGVPLMVSYYFGQGRITFHLAPKVGDD